MANKANLRLWVAALRSGAYAQGRGAMRQDTGPNVQYCCLGVAQEVALRAGFLPKGEVLWGQTSHLNSSIATEFYGLEERNGPLGYLGPLGYNVRLNANHALDGSFTSAAILNDDFLLTFDQIADAIERTFDLLTYDEIFDPSFVPNNETVAT